MAFWGLNPSKNSFSRVETCRKFSFSGSNVTKKLLFSLNSFLTRKKYLKAEFFLEAYFRNASFSGSNWLFCSQKAINFLIRKQEWLPEAFSVRNLLKQVFWSRIYWVVLSEGTFTDLKSTSESIFMVQKIVVWKSSFSGLNFLQKVWNKIDFTDRKDQKSVFF
jgi:hypothetical protein